MRLIKIHVATSDEKFKTSEYLNLSNCKLSSLNSVIRSYITEKQKRDILVMFDDTLYVVESDSGEVINSRAAANQIANYIRMNVAKESVSSLKFTGVINAYNSIRQMLSKDDVPDIEITRKENRDKEVRVQNEE